MEIWRIKITISIVIVVGGFMVGIYRDYRGRMWTSAGVSTGAVTRSYASCFSNCETPGMKAKTTEFSSESSPFVRSVSYEDNGRIEVNVGLAGNVPIVRGVAQLQIAAMTPVCSFNPADLQQALSRLRNPQRDEKKKRELNTLLFSNRERANTPTRTNDRYSPMYKPFTAKSKLVTIPSTN